MRKGLAMPRRVNTNRRRSTPNCHNSSADLVRIISRRGHCWSISSTTAHKGCNAQLCRGQLAPNALSSGKERPHPTSGQRTALRRSFCALRLIEPCHHPPQHITACVDENTAMTRGACRLLLRNHVPASSWHWLPDTRAHQRDSTRFLN